MKNRQHAPGGMDVLPWLTMARWGFCVMLLAGGFSLTAVAQGFLPSLESSGTLPNGMTPVMELMAPASASPMSASQPLAAKTESAVKPASQSAAGVQPIVKAPSSVLESMPLKPAAAKIATLPKPELSPLPGYGDTVPPVERSAQAPMQPSEQAPEQHPAAGPVAPLTSDPSASLSTPDADFRLKPAAIIQDAASDSESSMRKGRSRQKKHRPSKAQPESLTGTAYPQAVLNQENVKPVAQSAKLESRSVQPKPQSQAQAKAQPLVLEATPLASPSALIKPESTPPEVSDAEAAAARKPLKISVDVSQAIQDAKNIFKPDAIKAVSYTPMPGIAVFAVVKHGNERVFGDLPTLFAREYAQRLGVKVPGTKIYNPIYTVDELRMQGLGHVYDQIMSYYIKTGAPEPTAMDYLLKQISANRPSITRVVFVEADVDFTHPDASTNLMDRVKLAMTDDTPKQMKYFVNSRLQIFDAEKPGFPVVWGGSWRRSVKMDQFYNVTPSVYTDSDSQQAFARVSRQMSQEILFLTPKEAYMIPQYDTAVQGELVNKGLSANSTQAFPNLPETQPQANGRLSNENKQAIERILERQNSIAP